MSTRHHFDTDDVTLAAKIHAVVVEHETKSSGKVAQTAASPPAPNTNGASPPAPAATAAPPPPPPTAAVAPPPPPAPPAAAAAPPPPPAPPAAAAAPPPPPAAAAAPPPPPAADNALQIAPAGWTIEHVKDAAGKFTSNPAKGGASALAEALRPFCAPGEARPSIKKIYPAYWPQAHTTLSAA